MKNIIILLLSIPVSAVYAVVEEDVIPTMLQECYSVHRNNVESILTTQDNCIEQYLTHLFGNNSYSALDKNAMIWIESLGRNLHNRFKRQSGGYRRGGRRGGGRRGGGRRGGGYRRNCGNRRNGYRRNRGYGGYGGNDDCRRERKEIRTLTDKERKNFFDAVNALKQDNTDVLPNKYDALALLHQGEALSAGHRGPGFLPWHRYYLYLFEEALREKKRSVTLPYWDSRLDFVMDDPTESILWTELFLGNGQGVVFTGPFAEWRTPAENTLLRRDIPGPRSSLIDPVKIQNVLNKRNHHEILAPTAVNEENDIEIHHDAVHRWVGGRDGHMGGLTTSPQDPVFFLHHCFIDYLWELFRQRQKKLNIDSENDYPPTTDIYHQPDRVMDNLKPNMTMKDGYGNWFTTEVYKYAPSPSCKNRCGGAYRGFLHCKRGQCVSRARKEFTDMKGFNQVDSEYVRTAQSADASIRTSVNTATDAVGASPTPSFRAAMSVPTTSANAAPRISARFQVGIVDARTSRRKRRSVSSPEMHEKYDMKTGIQNVATIPVTIVNEHRLGLSFQENDKKSRLFNIEVETIGFTYNGRHREHISIDNQTFYSESSALVAFETPLNRETSAYVRAHDTFGGVCQAQCLDQLGETYKDCTGVIKVTNNLPLMYYNNDNIRNLQTDQTRQSFLRFYCTN